MVSDLEQVDVLSAAAAQGWHVAAGVEGGGLPTLGHSAPVHQRLLKGFTHTKEKRVYRSA